MDHNVRALGSHRTRDPLVQDNSAGLWFPATRSCGYGNRDQPGRGKTWPQTRVTVRHWSGPGRLGPTAADSLLVSGAVTGTDSPRPLASLTPHSGCPGSSLQARGGLLGRCSGGGLEPRSHAHSGHRPFGRLVSCSRVLRAKFSARAGPSLRSPRCSSG